MTKRNEAFATDNNALKVVDQNIEATKKALDAIVAAWNETTANAPLLMDEIKSWYDWNQESRPLQMDAINASLTRALIGSHQLYGEILDAELLRMTGKDRHDTTDFLEAAKLIRGYIGWHRWTNHVNVQAFDIRRGEVIVIPEEVEKLKQPFISIAATEGQQTRLKLARNVTEALEAIIALYPDAKRDNLSIPGLINTDGEVFTPSPYFVLEGAFASGGGVGVFASARQQPVIPKTEPQRTTAAPMDGIGMAGYNAAQRRNAPGLNSGTPGIVL